MKINSKGISLLGLYKERGHISLTNGDERRDFIVMNEFYSMDQGNKERTKETTNLTISSLQLAKTLCRKKG
jgi:hypothetical protein